MCPATTNISLALCRYSRIVPPLSAWKPCVVGDLNPFGHVYETDRKYVIYAFFNSLTKKMLTYPIGPRIQELRSNAAFKDSKKRMLPADYCILGRRWLQRIVEKGDGQRPVVLLVRLFLDALLLYLDFFLFFLHLILLNCRSSEN
jgi:hypothetical protein